MFKKEDFSIGNKVKIVSLTTTRIGDGIDDIFIGNTGVVVDIDEFYLGYNDLEIEFNGLKETWFVSACDLEIVNE